MTGPAASRRLAVLLTCATALTACGSTVQVRHEWSSDGALPASSGTPQPGDRVPALDTSESTTGAPVSADTAHPVQSGTTGIGTTSGAGAVPTSQDGVGVTATTIKIGVAAR